MGRAGLVMAASNHKTPRWSPPYDPQSCSGDFMHTVRNRRRMRAYLLATWVRLGSTGVIGGAALARGIFLSVCRGATARVWCRNRGWRQETASTGGLCRLKNSRDRSRAGRAQIQIIVAQSGQPCRCMMVLPGV
ncbi:hypothetical protein BDZ85DRAFT_41418 [Elsinoe ampelina]|uniref:Uncharacterized protein n=1 Tax=Elsinoe ampelina TaxID=302913 RepID=A0A6A6G2J3_9PEZI|nr:hypothetical protein BDZ85DRAFT_41418 [Elsinoe ampelina]